MINMERHGKIGDPTYPQLVSLKEKKIKWIRKKFKV